MTYRAKLFFFLFLAGFTGVLSLLLIDLSAVLAILPPETAGTQLPASPWVLKIASLIQPTVLVAVAALVGVLLASKVNLSAPGFEALARGEKPFSALKPQVFPGVIAGLIGAIAIVLVWVLVKPSLLPEFVARAEAFNRLLPVPTRLLYGGITEEVLLRWGVLTLLVWLAWKVFQRRRSEPGTVCFVVAIFISAILFGVGHLPVALVIGGRLTAAVVFYVISANSVFGLIGGYLYWRRGLEAAMIAHMFTHVCLILALRFLI